MGRQNKPSEDTSALKRQSLFHLGGVGRSGEVRHYLEEALASPESPDVNVMDWDSGVRLNYSYGSDSFLFMAGGPASKEKEEMRMNFLSRFRK